MAGEKAGWDRWDLTEIESGLPNVEGFKSCHPSIIGSSSQLRFLSYLCFSYLCIYHKLLYNVTKRMGNAAGSLRSKTWAWFLLLSECLFKVILQTGLRPLVLAWAPKTALSAVTRLLPVTVPTDQENGHICSKGVNSATAAWLPSSQTRPGLLFYPRDSSEGSVPISGFERLPFKFRLWCAQVVSI